MVSRKKSENVGKSNIWLYVGVFTTLVVIAFVAFSNDLLPLASASPPRQSSRMHNKPTVVSSKGGSEQNAGSSPSSKVSKKKGVPTYEEYIAQSIANNWKPADPVEKLEATVLKYGQVLRIFFFLI